ncbi:hypothetical protein PSTG_01394 [Puccinia striiformis f. sp. tritici PST-78]|uniref:Uncharacterized protein n=1 Tax=Puccinia striiformis f. sp. tritici PST-78 TaxID=1165861 RepID=A0A0L0W2U8_9BASI|nr:hypothetical protein PSTG_01394 [Puccinia striiformis f. sp. tritici PST-78]
MASNNRPKRHKNNTSTMSTSEPPDPIDNNQNNENESEDGDTNENEMENEDQNNAPEEDNETSGGRRQLTDEEELTIPSEPMKTRSVRAINRTIHLSFLIKRIRPDGA